MQGSWAGAMGHPQFMPTSFRSGWRWISTATATATSGESKADVFARPIANYLKGHGWTANQNWGREVAVSPAVASRIARDVAPRSGSCVRPPAT